jgi:hypothetical protein
MRDEEPHVWMRCRSNRSNILTLTLM